MPPEAPDTAGGHVLVAGADPERRRRLVELLAGEGFTAHTAADAIGAAELAARRSFAAVVVDSSGFAAAMEEHGGEHGETATGRILVDGEPAPDGAPEPFARVALGDPRELLLAVHRAVREHLARTLRRLRSTELALRDSEELRRSITDGSPDFIMMLDLDANFVFVNRTMTPVTIGEVIGTSIYSWVPEKHHRDMAECFARVLAGGGIDGYELEYPIPDRETLYFELRVGPVMRDGEIVALLVIGTDVSDRRRAEAKKAQLEAELRQSQKLEAVGTLASGIAHDLNNTLTAIAGNIELARCVLPPGHPALEPLATIEKASDQASDVTRSLLTFARKEPLGGLEPLALATIVRESLGLLRRLLPATIELAEEIPDDGSRIWIRGEGSQIQQVLINFAVNARDAMPEGGRLRVALAVSPADAQQTYGQATLTVEDGGTGMSPEVCGRVFEPFFTTKVRNQGTGLGLSVVHGIVSHHGGHVEVESKLGEGSRFAVTLPLCEPPPAAAAPLSGAAPAEPARGELILLAEDNEYVRTVMVASLEDAGYEVASAADGDETLEAFAALGSRLRLAVLDVDLPKRSGLACLEEIRAARRDLPVLIITGSTERAVPGTDPSTQRWLLKPFRMIQLIEAVRDMLTPGG